MLFVATANTDIGTVKDINQDSVLIKHASSPAGEVLMAIVCDGMGGLAKGELASATVIREFSEWFNSELPSEIDYVDMKVISGKWSLMLKDLNVRILEFGKKNETNLGTTFSGILFIGNQYMIVHVGDSRVYYIGASLNQLTADQTFVAREISRGLMSVEQAKVDPRRNILLQCVGASKIVEPQVIYGKVKNGAYLLCSDGFRHEVTESELYESLNPANLLDKETMYKNVKYLIDLIKSRQERDNISAVLVKTEVTAKYDN